MRDDYSYLDPDYQYTDPKTGVLRNLHNISDHMMLNIVESGVSTKRANELLEHPIKIKGTDGKDSLGESCQRRSGKLPAKKLVTGNR